MNGLGALARPAVRYAVAALVGLVGASLVAGGVGQLSHRASAPPVATYSDPAACSQCPPGIRLVSASVQARQGSKLFIFSGTWPSAPAGIPSDLRLVANQLDLQLHPSGGGFSLSSGGRPVGPDDVAVGLRPEALLINVNDRLLSTPITFRFGLWKTGSYLAQIPLAGNLVWSGSGALTLNGTADRTSRLPSPAPTAGPPDITAGAGACTAVASGSVPGILTPAKPAVGTAPDPRSQVPSRFVGLLFGAPGIGDQFKAQSPFSMTAVLLPTGGAAGAGSRPVDHMGSAQLWAFWDGNRLHKGLRTWDGRAWSMAVDTDAPTLTLEIRTAGIIFYWVGIQPGEHVGFLVAAAGGCAPLDLSGTGVPQVSVS